ncbi:MAG: DEAD/DEAH box helicase [Leptospiraceae bacterium]|nr:DEAD/DEAH box helicase [Leptospiraceae bacterium]
MKFEELKINENMLRVFNEIGYVELTPIQEKSIPFGLEGRDITGLAQTGTGKTLAFLIPIVNKILNENPEGPVALILAPTRELVMQICDEARRLLKYSDKKVSTIIGGTDYKEQLQDIEDKTEIIVATPGRLIDHIKSGKLSLANISFFVLDEADRMFDMGFIKDIRYVMKKCPDNKQVMLFSATLSYYVIRLASEYLRDPVEVSIASDTVVTENIDQKLIHLGRDEKLPYLVNMILNDTEEGLGIIFTNLKMMVPDIVSRLSRFGIPATGISSLLDQKKRVRLLKDFKFGKYKYMVATDVASRGIDVDNIKVVYNYDLPMDTENYVHRIGRTARAGKKGRSVSFCSERDYAELEKIEKFLGNKLDTMQVEEAYLKFPQGDFTPFIGEKLKGEINPNQTNKPNRNSNYKGKNSFPPKKRDENSFPPKRREEGAREDKFKKDKFKKAKPAHFKKEPINPLEEAKLYLQKADSVLGSEKPKAVIHPSKKETHINQKEKVHRVKPQKPYEPKKENYDKSKRNLFDINETNHEVKKPVSIWKKIKSIFGR